MYFRRLTNHKKEDVKVVYRELVSKNDFSQCIDLQRSLFKLSDIDVVSPLILQLIARENPPMGFILGAFNVCEEKEELIGLTVAMATSQEKSVYCPMIGVKSQYQSLGYGGNLILKLLEIALKKNIDYLYGVFEPLDSKLARFYINHIGITGTYYQESDYYMENDIPTDKLLFKWDLKAFSSHNRNRNNAVKSFKSFSVATKEYMPDLPVVLIEIPNDYSMIKKVDIAEAKHWRKCTKDLFIHYINERNYIVYDCLSVKENQIKKIFYLLKAT